MIVGKFGILDEGKETVQEYVRNVLINFTCEIRYLSGGHRSRLTPLCCGLPWNLNFRNSRILPQFQFQS